MVFKRGKQVIQDIPESLLLEIGDILVIEGFLHDLKKLYHRYF